MDHHEDTDLGITEDETPIIDVEDVNSEEANSTLELSAVEDQLNDLGCIYFFKYLY